MQKIIVATLNNNLSFQGRCRESQTGIVRTESEYVFEILCNVCKWNGNAIHLATLFSAPWGGGGVLDAFAAQ